MPDVPSLPRDERVYAIGDIHGRLDLLERLIAMIRRDADRRSPARTRIILLGDLIDRGKGSRAVVERCRRLTESNQRFIVLRGNHEAMMVAALGGDFQALGLWLKEGGDATLLDWGLPEDLIALGPTVSLLTAARHVVAPDVLTWMAALPASFRLGNCLFVHAGIRPGRRLSRQSETDMLWIRREFLDSKDDLPVLVVHGHSDVAAVPAIRQSRLGVDTSAYRTGRLTAVGIEDQQLWFVQTVPEPVTPSQTSSQPFPLFVASDPAFPVFQP